MTFHSPAKFRVAAGLVLLALGLLGTVSLATKEVPLALFGEHATATVQKVEVVQTSTASKWEKEGFGPKKSVSRGGSSTFMHLAFTTREGRPMEVKTLSTFNTGARVGDAHPIIYLPSHPGKAKIYSAKQLWLPMIAGVIFSTFCLLSGFFLVRGRR